VSTELVTASAASVLATGNAADALGDNGLGLRGDLALGSSRETTLVAASAEMTRIKVGRRSDSRFNLKFVKVF
jgi:hypothetical protein